MAKVRKPTVRWMNGDTLHVETPNGIVNIIVGLTDASGRSVDAIQVTPSNFAGETKVLLRGYANTRLVRCKRAKVGR
jgi:hypothetical protein